LSAAVSIDSFSDTAQPASAKAEARPKRLARRETKAGWGANGPFLHDSRILHGNGTLLSPGTSRFMQ
jgi:hypothetical protein